MSFALVRFGCYCNEEMSCQRVDSVGVDEFRREGRPNTLTRVVSDSAALMVEVMT